MVQGFNENVNYQGCVFHIQTEDMGADRATIVSTVFLGGMVVFRKELKYSELVSSGIDKYKLSYVLERLHKKVKHSLLQGEYDELINRIVRKKTEELTEECKELIEFLKKDVLPALHQDFQITLSRDQLGRILSTLKDTQQDSSTKRRLMLLKAIYEEVQDRIDKQSYKALVKRLMCGEPAEDTGSLEKFGALLRRVVKDDIAGVTGASLAEALLSKILDEIHPVFIKQPHAFEVIVERILNSGIIQKRTDEQWRKLHRERWLEKYRNITGSGHLNV